MSEMRRNLVETDFENINIDVCDKCAGVWFASGELTHVADRDDESGWFRKLVG